MAPGSPPSPVTHVPDASSTEYTSTILKLFVDTLARWKDVQILDVGPVCEENIMFFGRRMKRLYVCDMFLHLPREMSKGPRLSGYLDHLDYPQRHFDGIMLWDLCDHLCDVDMRLLLKHCFSILRSKGLLMLTAFEHPPDPQQITTFVIGQNFRMGLRRQPHLELAWHCRHNRALMSELTDFNHVKSYRHRSGLREFLFRKPGLIRD